MSEDYKPGPCDHDDDVMRTHTFFDRATVTHLARLRLVAMIQAKAHWIVAVTPDCARFAASLSVLHYERCGPVMTIVGLRDLDCHPAMCVLPRDQVSLDDLVEAAQLEPTITADVDEAPWFLLTRGDTRQITHAIGEWIDKDNLLN
jgi:hypothetical protein